MGRPYNNEIRSLPDTYKWSSSQKCEQLKALFSNHIGRTLVGIGSGGSYSTATAAVALHRYYHRSPGFAVTPLDLEISVLEESNCSLWLFSGSGRNIDIRRCIKQASSEHNQLTIFCGKKSSPLEDDARKAYVDRIFSFDTELGKDGYLATNSLFASTTILASAFVDVPTTLQELVKSALGDQSTEEVIKRSLCSAVEGCTNAIILHGPGGRAGALDLESKFTEGAIIASSVADYRNFAHGRHNWINRFGAESFIVAFVGPGEGALANQTLGLLPDKIATVVVPLGENFAIAQTLSVYFSILIAGWLGEAQGIDPGRPHIPAFGRKLYHLRTRLSAKEKNRTMRQVIVERKVRAHGVRRATNDQLEVWSRCYSKFRNHLKRKSIRAIVFDYDGTLVDTKNRFQPPVPELVSRLEELLVEGLPIGIATGRGDSLRVDLRSVINQKFHERVVIGYNNASNIALLHDNPDLDGDIEDAALANFYEQLLGQPFLTKHMDVRTYPKQISLRAPDVQDIRSLWTEVHSFAESIGDLELNVLISGHSLDVLPKNVSKLNLLYALAEGFGIDPSSILCIGDSGSWPGNDAELLRTLLSLSVDRVSADPSTCWNLLPPRCRGVNGVLYYLNRLEIHNGAARIKI